MAWAALRRRKLSKSQLTMSWNQFKKRLERALTDLVGSWSSHLKNQPFWCTLSLITSLLKGLDSSSAAASLEGCALQLCDLAGLRLPHARQLVWRQGSLHCGYCVASAALSCIVSPFKGCKKLRKGFEKAFEEPLKGLLKACTADRSIRMTW